LDTREKIVPLQDLPERLGKGPWLAVVGRFDPLTLPQAERLGRLAGEGHSILGVVEPSADCLLPADARATLLAALRSVNLVVIADAAWLPPHPQMKILEDEEGERKRSAEFAQFIVERQG
jgi:hypothetical protein